ncbi:hypothetical protein FQR65_LT13995 [Abscondita terminalis]|nr:hypothetical protein FQR65_LT13995 [Abscondita terminalis]
MEKTTTISSRLKGIEDEVPSNDFKLHQNSTTFSIKPEPNIDEDQVFNDSIQFSFSIPKQEIIKDEYVLFDTDCIEETTTYYCHQCIYSSNDKNDLIDHVSTHKFKCNLSITWETSKKHTYKHSGDWSCVCDECDYKCRDKTTLTRHKRTHTKEKPFKCKTCDYSCSQSAGLKYHSYKHTGEWPYSCDKCDYKTSTKCLLIRHELKHVI